MTGNEKLNENEHIFRNSQLVSDNFTEEGLTETYVETLAMFEEIRQYRKIGTVEECREAREKQIKKKPVKNEHNHDCCPKCGWIVYQQQYGGRYLPHCENCGQAIDWSDIPG